MRKGGELTKLKKGKEGNEPVGKWEWRPPDPWMESFVREENSKNTIIKQTLLSQRGWREHKENQPQKTASHFLPFLIKRKSQPSTKIKQ